MQPTKPKQSSASVLQSLSDRRVLPIFPGVITRLDSALGAASVSLDEVVSILSADLNTFSRIMKSASGFRYGSQPPKDLAEAVMRLGFAETRALTFAVAYTSSFEKPKNFSMATFWMHAFVSGLAAKEISAWLYRHKKMRVCDGPTAFLLGLSHEVGCLLLDKLNDEDFGSVVDELKTSNESQSALEQKRLGTTHAIIGAALLKYWGFTDNMVMAVAGHHFPARLPAAQQPIADMVLLAESMAGYMGFDNGVDKATPGLLNSFVSERMQVIGMSEADFLRISERIKDALAEEDWMELASSTK